jgi:hypothetical protein
MPTTCTRREALRIAVFAAPIALVTGSAAAAPHAGARVVRPGAPNGAGGPSSAGAEPRLGAAPLASEPVGERAFADLAPGLRVGRCTLVEVCPIEAGGVPIVLRSPDGSTFTVDVLRHDPQSPGVAQAGELSVFLRNGGRGAKRTDEAHGLAAMALAGILAQRQARGQAAPRLLTLRQRIPALAALYPR